MECEKITLCARELQKEPRLQRARLWMHAQRTHIRLTWQRIRVALSRADPWCGRRSLWGNRKPNLNVVYLRDRFRMAARLSKEERESLKKFQSLMALAPEALVFRCKSCARLRETTELSDPMFRLQSFECHDLGSRCELSETVGPSVRPTEARYVPGSFVIASRDEQYYLPGMIDYIPGKHPEYVEKKLTPFSSTAAKEVYHVSLLNDRDQEYASETFYIQELTPMDASFAHLMPNAEARRKYRLCMEMQRGDIRHRLYKFSYMAHKYGLEDPIPGPIRRIPIRHGSFVAPGETTKDVYVDVVPDLRHNAGTPARLSVPYSGPPHGTLEADEYLDDLREKTGLDAMIVSDDETSER